MKLDNWQFIALIVVMFTALIISHVWAPAVAAAVLSMVMVLFNGLYVQRHSETTDVVVAAKAEAAAAEVKRIEAEKVEAHAKADATAKTEAARVEAEKKAEAAAAEAAAKAKSAADTAAKEAEAKALAEAGKTTT